MEHSWRSGRGLAMSGPQPSSSAYQPAISHNGSGGLYANLGAGKQRNHIQDGTNNHQINVDTITNYYATHQAETPPQPTHTIPFTRDDGFVERAELSQLQHLLSRSGRRVALYGLGGVGWVVNSGLIARTSIDHDACTANHNLPSSTAIVLGTTRQKHGSSGYTRAVQSASTRICAS